MLITLDTESKELLDAYVAYVPAAIDHLPGVVHDAIMTGLLSTWADSAATVPIESLLQAETRRVLPASEAAFEVDFTPRADSDPRRATVAKAQALAAAWGVDPSAVYLAAARIGLGKFAASIALQTGKATP